MHVNKEFREILMGRIFKKMLDHIFEDICGEYNLKLIEVEVMLYLFQHPQDVASDIKRNLHLNKGHISLALNHLCANGYLAEGEECNDHRFVRYVITEKGHMMLDKVVITRDAIYERMFTGISKNDIDVLERVMPLISKNINELYLDAS